MCDHHRHPFPELSHCPRAAQTTGQAAPPQPRPAPGSPAPWRPRPGQPRPCCHAVRGPSGLVSCAGHNIFEHSVRPRCGLSPDFTLFCSRATFRRADISLLHSSGGELLGGYYLLSNLNRAAIKPFVHRFWFDIPVLNYLGYAVGAELLSYMAILCLIYRRNC